MLVELPSGSRLIGTNLTGFDIRSKVVFTPDRLPEETPKHRDLSDMGDGIGDGTLDKAFRRSHERRGTGQVIVQSLQARVEPSELGTVLPGRLIVPDLLSFRHGKGPIAQVTKVSKDLNRRASGGRRPEVREVCGSSLRGLGRAVGERGQKVPKDPSFCGRIGAHFFLPFLSVSSGSRLLVNTW